MFILRAIDPLQYTNTLYYGKTLNYGYSQTHRSITMYQYIVLWKTIMKTLNDGYSQAHRSITMKHEPIDTLQCTHRYRQCMSHSI